MLKGILAIAGQSGLSRLVSETKNCIIVESLLTGKRMPVFSSTRVSSLVDIAIYTDTEEVSLASVLKNIFDKEGGKQVETKDIDYKAYFGEVLPNFDRDRVHTSDMKKIVSWYNLLLEKELLVFEEKKEEEKAEEKAEENKEEEESK